MGRPGGEFGSVRPVGVVGAGYVGIATATVLSSWGTRTLVVERDDRRLQTLLAGRLPFFEPTLEDEFARVVADGTLRLTKRLVDLVESDIAIICVGTPPRPDGTVDLDAVDEVARGLASICPRNATVVVKSTVPPGTLERISGDLGPRRPDLGFVSCPEFLREGSSGLDARSPTRIVVGGSDGARCRRVADLFSPSGAPVIFTSATSAELIKYGANAFLAMKISFVNELSHFCDLVGANVTEVAEGIGADPRIGTSSLRAGLGFGGSCFPKDVRALEEFGAALGYQSLLLKACSDINAQQKERIVAKLQAALNGRLEKRRVAVLGLAFKPGTDDVRQSPALDMIARLVEQGATVTASDPIAVPGREELPPGVRVLRDPFDCVNGVDAILLATEWPEYRSLDWARVRGLVRGTVIVDGRNVLDVEELARLGFSVFGVGTPNSGV